MDDEAVGFQESAWLRGRFRFRIRTGTTNMGFEWLRLYRSRRLDRTLRPRSRNDFTMVNLPILPASPPFPNPAPRLYRPVLPFPYAQAPGPGPDNRCNAIPG